ncbi:RepB family plasmid replication initiator protein (plasmid) [Sphingobium sp. CAP-1]|nr:RepB family plasmid replication initiator protein [Sphingobium sp. CAP-1]
MASMEHPIFSVSTKPDFTKRSYEHGNAILRVSPSPNGLATVHDRDVLIYCISQIMAAINKDQKVSQVVRFKAYDLLVATNRGTDGRGYEQLKAAFKRLQGTQIETNIITGGQAQWDVFSLVDRASIIRESFDGRMIDVEVKLSDWVFNAIRAKEVLTLNRRYFRLRKPLERRLYEIARKHCGFRPGKPVKFGLDTIQKKCGSQSTSKEFKRLLKTIVEQDELHDHFPDYTIRLDDAGDMVTFTPRADKTALPQSTLFPMISENALQKARMIAPGYDVYALKSDYLAFWDDKGRQELKNPDAAFLGWCKKRNERNPLR